jgi:hypothetical protein
MRADIPSTLVARPRCATSRHAPRIPATNIALVQELLKEKYDHDLHINGMWDGKTNTAYTRHQRTLGMKSLYCDGSPNMEDLKKLVGTKYKIK